MLHLKSESRRSDRGGKPTYSDKSVKTVVAFLYASRGLRIHQSRRFCEAILNCELTYLCCKHRQMDPSLHSFPTFATLSPLVSRSYKIHGNGVTYQYSRERCIFWCDEIRLVGTTTVVHHDLSILGSCMVVPGSSLKSTKSVVYK